MAFTHGSKASLRIGDATNLLTTLTPYLTSVSFPVSVDTAETTTLGASAKAYLPGLADATLSIEGKFDPAADALLTAIKGLADRAFEYGPQGNATGSVKYTGNCILTSYEIATEVGDAASFSAEFQVTGPVTRGTF